MTDPLAVPRLMLVTDRLRASGPIVGVVRSAVDGGAQAVQVREKDLSDKELTALAREIRDALPAGIPALINGSGRIAGELGIGLHLPESMPFPVQDQNSLKPGALVGRSVHGAESARQSVGADYVIAGHVFETSSKTGIPVLGLSGLTEIVQAAPCPVLAIGGVSPERVREVLATGAHGIAVMSGICASDDPFSKAREYLCALNEEHMTNRSDTTKGLIEVQVNGKLVDLGSGTTVSGFLEQKGLHQNMVVVEHNGHILKKGQFDDVEINGGDVLEVVHFVGGG